MVFSYKASGVDIAGLDKSRDAIGKMITATHTRIASSTVTSTLGHYAGIVKSKRDGFIATHTDGVGTKLLIASAMEKYDTVGIDCVAMNANDIICVGATPVSFVDYIAASRNDARIFKKIIKGLVKGAKQARVPIVGGETAIIPELLRPGKFSFDLAGTIVGIIPKKRIILGRSIKRRDVIIGAHSSGLHSNGYTLARKVLSKYRLTENIPKVGKLGNVLLEPTKIYVSPILEILEKCNVHGLAHITGGGFSNLLRLKRTLYELDSMPKVPPIMELIASKGIKDAEMHKTFNMGVGMCIVASESGESQIMSIMRKHKIHASVIGHIGTGSGVKINSTKIV